MPQIDVIVVGQGLAGTVLTWQLLERGLSVRVLDPGHAITASRVAAGLITPILGQRLTLAVDWQAFWPVAHTFYRHLEKTLQCEFLGVQGAVRWFQCAEEQTLFLRRRALGEYDPIQTELLPAPDEALFRAPWGGFTMAPAARLQVARLLDASRRVFQERQLWIQSTIDNEDINFLPDTVRIPKCQLESRFVVFCRGAEERLSPFFGNVRFKPAKGEILKLSIPPLNEGRTLHHNVWLARQQGNEYLCGSTYTWDTLDTLPTPEGRQGLLQRLTDGLKVDLEVITHQAAVRPSVADSRPVVGRHVQRPQLALFNGLGARGSLWAPQAALWLVEELCGNASTPIQYGLQRWRP